MVESRRGLGRGLSALMEEAQAATTQEARRAAGVQELPIELVRRNADQPRRHFDVEVLQELADSIRERGVSPADSGSPRKPKRPANFRLSPVSGAGGLRSSPGCIRFPRWFGSSSNDLEVLELAMIEEISSAPT